MTLIPPYYIAESPSNIAFIKYWGKLPEKIQWAANSSLSMTLSNCKSITKSSVRPEGFLDHAIEINGKKIERGNLEGKKIFSHLDYLSDLCNSNLKLDITTENTFPTSSGIASSASGFSALTISSLAALTDSKSLLELYESGFSLEKLADISRLGSGSAGRSLFGGIVEWFSGKIETQKFSQIYNQKHWELCDSIVVFSNLPKDTSSSDAHKKVWTSPFYKIRLEGIDHLIEDAIKAIKNKNMKELGWIIEQEALDMHSISIAAEDSVIFPNSLAIEFMEWLRKLRKETGLEVYFTLDAGTNVHLIHEPHCTEKLYKELKKFDGIKGIISDKIGHGPTLQYSRVSKKL